MQEHIRDYLDTQGLALNHDEVAVAVAALTTVWQLAEADIPAARIWALPQRRFDPSTPLPQQALQAAVLAEHLPDTAANQKLLRRLYALADSAHERLPETHLAVYALRPEAGHLLRLVQFGDILEGLLPVNDTGTFTHLAARAAQTAWVNIADSVPQWLDWGDLSGARHHHSGAQAAFPITHTGGSVLGVVYAEHAQAQAFTSAAQVWLSALALAAVAPILTLFPHTPIQADA